MKPIHCILTMACIAIAQNLSTAAQQPPPIEAERGIHNGRPTLLLDGHPTTFTAYSPVNGRYPAVFTRQTTRFFSHRLAAYLVDIPPAATNDFFATPFWNGDTIIPEPILTAVSSLDNLCQHILQGDPDAHIIIRFRIHEPASWRALHADDLVVTETGRRLPAPSLASTGFKDRAALYCAAIITYCESRPWAHRIIGYANFLRFEGTHEPMIDHWLFDHSPVMRRRWRTWLLAKYATDAALQKAYDDKTITLASADIPRDRLRGAVESVAALPYWQSARDNQALRDYLDLTRTLFHEQFSAIAGAMRSTLDRIGRKRLVLFDALKQPMLGWSNSGFFNPGTAWPLAFAEDRSGSGHIGIATLLDLPAVDGLITPHDYQLRGIGGITQPEAAADSTILRGKLVLCEMDTRTFAGRDKLTPARTESEFEAVTWRTVADGITRGYAPYWMDVYEDWFTTTGMHNIISRQAAVLRESTTWRHETVPGIAMIIDDEAVLETNGDGRFFNEAIMWETKLGLARCGVPFRIYLFDDLKRADFPEHRVYFFPNLFRVDAERLAILKQKVFRDEHVVVWGPGSGISDGSKIGADSATLLTGFEFDWLPVNFQRRVFVTDFDHPLTRSLDPATCIGGTLAFGPALYPRTGRILGAAWTKQGRHAGGLAALDMEGWRSVFTAAIPLPADLWRNLARWAGAHIYCDDNEIILADSGVVAIHTAKPGPKTIMLPRRATVVDVISGAAVAGDTNRITCTVREPTTRVFRLLP